VGVVMGCDGKNSRFSFAKGLLEAAFGEVRRVPLLKAGEMLKDQARTKNAEASHVSLQAKEELWVVVKRAEMGRVKLVPQLPGRLAAPMPKGARVGEMHAIVDGKVRGRTEITLAEELPEGRSRWKLIEGARPTRTTPDAAP
jgi:D-alanyl-D-alanine carboxypeptidase (penicillin-binding protein 5/6)